MQGCPANQYSGATATPNVPQLYFLYVARAGGSPLTNIYGINYVCVGGVANSTTNMNILSTVVSKNPDNAVDSALRGDASICALPTPTGDISISIPSSEATFPGSATSENLSLLAVFFSTLAALF
jgi:hypothetical protein